MGFTSTQTSLSDLKSLTLGYYDFNKFSVILGNHLDPNVIPITLFHEGQHQRLNIASSYGRALSAVAERIKIEDNHLKKEELNSLFDFLIDRCVTVQEMQATYLSIAEYNAEYLYDSMPDEYKLYYKLMESTVQNLPNSKYFKFYGAWILCNIAMATSEIGKPNLDDINQFYNFYNNDTQSPNHRMNIIFEAMKELSFDDIIKKMINYGSSEIQIQILSQYNDKEKICEALGENIENWEIIKDNLVLPLQSSLFEYFETYFLDLDHSRTATSTYNGFDYIKIELNYFRADIYIKTFKVLIESCNQKITFYPPKFIKTKVVNINGFFFFLRI